MLFLQVEMKIKKNLSKRQSFKNWFGTTLLAVGKYTKYDFSDNKFIILIFSVSFLF